MGTKITKIVDKIFIGPVEILYDPEGIKSNNIGCFVILNGTDVNFQENIHVFKFPLEDCFEEYEENPSLYTLFKDGYGIRELAKNIKSEVSSGRNVCVVCDRGFCRSPTVVVAYLILEEGYRLLDATRLVCEKRGHLNVMIPPWYYNQLKILVEK